MSTPTDLPLDELHALRERAYGPTADIHADPAAMARLAELEAQARASVIPALEPEPDAAPPAWSSPAAFEEVTPAAVAGVPLAPAVAEDAAELPGPREEGAHLLTHEVAGPDPGSETTPQDDAEADAVAGEPPVPTPWWRRRIPLLWAGSVVAALIVGAGLTLAIESVESGTVAVLAPNPDAEWTDIWGGDSDESVGFDEFYGLSVISQPQQWSSAGDVLPCLAVFGGEPDNIIFAGSGCGAGTFPAVAAFVVNRDSPQELRDRFPVGTALQFVLDDERVLVYAEEPLVTRPTP